MNDDPRPVSIIGEVGLVHDGSLGNALRLIDIVADSGADIVKFQTHIAQAETLRDAPSPPYFSDEPRYQYFERTAFDLEGWQTIAGHCTKRSVEFASSPFSLEAVELLELVGVSQYKIASGEVTNLPLLEEVGNTGKPTLLSSGMSTWEELDRAVNSLMKFHDRITVLQCTSAYPCPYEHVGLNVLEEMRDRYQLPVGLSDHTVTNYAPLAAVALGAVVVEKHLTFSRKMYGSDASHSLEPSEFRELVDSIRAVQLMLGSPVNKDDQGQLREMKEVFEKSIVSTTDISKGTTITRNMIGFKKPGTGIPASQSEEVMGRRALKDISADRQITAEDIE